MSEDKGTIRECVGCGVQSSKPLSNPMPLVLPCDFAWTMAKHCKENYCEDCWYNHMYNDDHPEVDEDE